MPASHEKRIATLEESAAEIASRLADHITVSIKDCGTNSEELTAGESADPAAEPSEEFNSVWNLVVQRALAVPPTDVALLELEQELVELKRAVITNSWNSGKDIAVRVAGLAVRMAILMKERYRNGR